MISKLFHLFGPLYVNSYGLAIGIALIIFTLCLKYDEKRAELISYDLFLHLLSWGILVGIVGGRLLYAVSEWHMFNHSVEIFALWQGGFSILGTIIALSFVMPWMIRRYRIPTLALLDRCALYAPLVQAISRIGCFFAGCCYGAPSTVYWAITYADVDSIAPLYCSLHPTQLYSSFLFFLIFIFLFCFIQYRVYKPGNILFWYLFLQSIERFFVDFFRGDRIYSTMMTIFSLYQWIALTIAAAAFICLWFNSIMLTKNHERF